MFIQRREAHAGRGLQEAKHGTDSHSRHVWFHPASSSWAGGGRRPTVRVRRWKQELGTDDHAVVVGAKFLLWPSQSSNVVSESSADVGVHHAACTCCAMVANVSKLPDVSGAIVREASVAASPHCMVSIVGFD